MKLGLMSTINNSNIKGNTMKKIVLLSIIVLPLFSSITNIIEWFPSDSTRLTPYNESYILLHPNDTKIQTSFKYNVFSQFYISYTQLIYWDLFSKSSPFKDINCNPEIFYRLKFNNKFFVKFLQAGYFHKSNGKDGIADRSMDRVNVTSSADIFVTSRVNVMWKQEYWYNFHVSSRNKDVFEYIGFQKQDLIVKLVQPLTSASKVKVTDQALTVSWMVGGLNYRDTSRYSFAFGYQFRTFVSRIIFKNYFHPLLYVRYENGFWDSLANYNNRVNIIRVGFILE